MSIAAFDTSRTFSTAQAVATGISASRLRGKEFRRLAKGKYVSAERSPSALLTAEAALLGHPDQAFASHSTAAAVDRMAVPHDVWQHVSVVDPGARRRRRGVRSHVASARTQALTLN
jgi:hypothetical protein